MATSFRVTFTNEDTKEYLYYDCKVDATAAPEQGTIAMVAPVRSLFTYRISINNPLPNPVMLTAQASDKQVRAAAAMPPAPIVFIGLLDYYLLLLLLWPFLKRGNKIHIIASYTVLRMSYSCLTRQPPSAAQVLVAESTELAAKSTTDVTVSYRPLLVGSKDARLTLSSKELGVYEYSLKLQGMDVIPERSVGFSVPLGARDTQVYRFTHWSDQACVYTCSFASGAAALFECQPSINVEAAGPHGKEVELQLHFEPSVLGENIRDMLLISSPVGGQYQCPVKGRCIPPKPQVRVALSCFIMGCTACCSTTFLSQALFRVLRFRADSCALFSLRRAPSILWVARPRSTSRTCSRRTPTS